MKWYFLSGIVSEWTPVAIWANPIPGFMRFGAWNGKKKWEKQRVGKKGREAEREGYRKGGKGRDRKKKRGTRIHREMDQENEVCLWWQQ